IPGIDRQQAESRESGNFAPRQASVGAAQDVRRPSAGIKDRWRRGADQERTDTTQSEPTGAAVGALGQYSSAQRIEDRGVLRIERQKPGWRDKIVRAPTG